LLKPPSISTARPLTRAHEVNLVNILAFVKHVI